MARTTTKCEFPGCRNVGRKDWEIVSESGKKVCDTECFMFVCRKHLIQAIEDAAERANTKADEEQSTS